MLRKDSGTRQVMLNENYEIYEKHGITKSNIMLHYHNFYEIIHITDGEYCTHIDGYEYKLKAGDFLLIDSNKLHRPFFDNPLTHINHRIVLWISKDMLNSISDDKTDLKSCFSMGPAFSFPVYERIHISQLLFNILIKEEDKESFGNDLLIKSYFTEFFILFNRLCQKKSYATPKNIYYRSLYDDVTEYVDMHIKESITIDTLASSLYMSKYYFLRKFKEETSITVHDFIIHKRLIKACQYIDEGTPVSKVYLLCGFNDYSSFFRNFKNCYDMSPKQYVSLKIKHI